MKSRIDMEAKNRRPKIQKGFHNFWFKSHHQPLKFPFHVICHDISKVFLCTRQNSFPVSAVPWCKVMVICFHLRVEFCFEDVYSSICSLFFPTSFNQTNPRTSPRPKDKSFPWKSYPRIWGTSKKLHVYYVLGPISASKQYRPCSTGLVHINVVFLPKNSCLEKCTVLYMAQESS